MTASEGDGRARVLAAARALFLERGYMAVSMQEIADAAGMRKASLYYHFRDKEDLFVEVVRQEWQQLARGIAAELAKAATLEDQLYRVARFFFGAVHSDLGRLMSDCMQHTSPDVKLRMHKEIDALQVLLRGPIEQAVATGELRDIDPELAVALFISMLTGLIRQKKERWVDVIIDDSTAALIADIFLHGVAAPASAPRN